jgi:hypothetical protein
MKINEIRHGSWVLCNDIPRKVKKVNNDGTHDSQVELYYKPNFLTNAECLNPIPLSTEIMEKNGFEVYGDEDGQTKYAWTGYGEDNEDDIEIEFDLANERIQTKIDIKGWYIVTSEIRNVHELQNLFWDCGIEIEIERV